MAILSFIKKEFKNTRFVFCARAFVLAILLSNIITNAIVIKNALALVWQIGFVVLWLMSNKAIDRMHYYQKEYFDTLYDWQKYMIHYESFISELKSEVKSLNELVSKKKKK